MAAPTRPVPLSFLLFVLLLLLVNPLGVLCQQLINGQYYTEGLAIIDSPQPSSQFSAGGNIALAIEVSGDGKLNSDAYAVGSTAETAFLGLEVYLISETVQINFTVVSGVGDGDILAGEVGSTVKHFNFNVPQCLPAAQYSLTFYESSRINGSNYFVITPMPVTISNSNPQPSAECNIVTTPLSTPQASSPPLTQPFLGTPNAGGVSPSNPDTDTDTVDSTATSAPPPSVESAPPSDSTDQSAFQGSPEADTQGTSVSPLPFPVSTRPNPTVEELPPQVQQTIAPPSDPITIGSSPAASTRSRGGSQASASQAADKGGLLMPVNGSNTLLSISSTTVLAAIVFAFICALI